MDFKKQHSLFTGSAQGTEGSSGYILGLAEFNQFSVCQVAVDLKLERKWKDFEESSTSDLILSLKCMGLCVT